MPAPMPMSAGIVVPPGGAAGVPPAGGAAGVPPGGPARHPQLRACLYSTDTGIELRLWWSLLPLNKPVLQWVSRAFFHVTHLQVAQPVAQPVAQSALPGPQAEQPD